MSFASLTFLLYLLGMMLVYFLAPARIRWAVLLAASYLYLGITSPHTAIYLLLTTAAVFFAAQKIERIQAAFASHPDRNRWEAQEKRERKQACQREKRYGSRWR